MYKRKAAVPGVRSLRRTRLAGRWLAGMMMALVPLASAGTIGISDGKLIVGTEPGDGGVSINVSIVGSDLAFSISGAPFVVVTPGCAGVSLITCSLSGFNEVDVLGGDGDDAIILSDINSPPPFATFLFGGKGADVLVGSAGDDTIFGDAGDDLLIGGPGVDCLVPGTGSDVVIQAPLTCGGPEPVITPLPRPATASSPEPGAVWLFASGIVALPLTRRFRRTVSRE